MSGTWERNRSMALWRLDRILTHMGVCSRREVKAFLRAGRVCVGGQKSLSPEDKFDPEEAEIRVDGQRIFFSEHVYLILNKPVGILSAKESETEKAAIDLLPEPIRKREVYPAGRLDKDASGLLLMTDDGDFCHQVISPKKRVYKRYEVRCEGCPSPEDAALFEKGILLEDGTTCLPGKLEILQPGPESRCAVVICEGKFHQVKRMMAAVGKPVISLRRTDIGSVHLDEDLQPGEYRVLRESEAKMALQNGDYALQWVKNHENI